QTSCQHGSEMATDRVACLYHNKIDPTLPGSREVVNATLRLAEDRGTDHGTESDTAGVGRVLQARPCPNTLPPTRPLDRAAHLVASFSAVADHGLEAVATCD